MAYVHSYNNEIELNRHKACFLKAQLELKVRLSECLARKFRLFRLLFSVTSSFGTLIMMK